MMSETPRTDAEQDGSETIDEAFNFARQLERELAEARGQLHLCNVDQFTTAAELAEAVTKERERCARVAEKYPSDLHTRPEQWLAAEIAAAIRKGE